MALARTAGFGFRCTTAVFFGGGFCAPKRGTANLSGSTLHWRARVCRVPQRTRRDAGEYCYGKDLARCRRLLNSPGFQSVQKRRGKTAAEYEVKRVGDHVTYSVNFGNGSKLSLPVEEMVGGNRHGISFLQRLDAVDGIPLDRPPLLEGRYAYSPSRHTLELSPGFALENSRTLGSQIGTVLSPTFEQKCVTLSWEAANARSQQVGRRALRKLPWTGFGAPCSRSYG
jgi:hypothetical protein